jgi:hypothetical protein
MLLLGRPSHGLIAGKYFNSFVLYTWQKEASTMWKKQVLQGSRLASSSSSPGRVNFHVHNPDVKATGIMVLIKFSNRCSLLHCPINQSKRYAIRI